MAKDFAKRSVLAASAAMAAFVALPQLAHAQLGYHDSIVYDELREGHLKAIMENTGTEHAYSLRKFNEDSVEPHYQSQIDHYELQIKKLDKLITSMTRITVAPDDNSEVPDGPSDDVFKAVASGSGTSTPGIRAVPSRKLVADARKGDSNKFAIEIGDPSSTSGTAPAGFEQFYKDYGWIKPEKVYRGMDRRDSTGRRIRNAAMRHQLEQLHNALYLTETTVGEVDAAREDILANYEYLSEEAKSAVDLKRSLEVNNAILLENGRNLATLINLQTAALNAEAADLRQMARVEQASTELMGSEQSNDQGGVAGILTLLGSLATEITAIECSRANHSRIIDSCT